MQAHLLLKHGFLIIREFEAPRNIVREEDPGDIIIVPASYVVYEELLIDRNPTVETYLLLHPKKGIT